MIHIRFQAWHTGSRCKCDLQVGSECLRYLVQERDVWTNQCRSAFAYIFEESDGLKISSDSALTIMEGNVTNLRKIVCTGPALLNMARLQHSIQPQDSREYFCLFVWMVSIQIVRVHGTSRPQNQVCRMAPCFAGAHHQTGKNKGLSSDWTGREYACKGLV